MPAVRRPLASDTARPAPARAARAPAGLKARRAEATRQHLIGTAIDVLHERSYQGATVFEVAKAAGVTPGALQHHFGSKAVLMMQVTDAIIRASGPEGVAWPAAEGPLSERCLGLVLALWRRAYEPPRFLAAWAVYFGSAGEPELRSHIAEQRGALTQALHRRFVQVLPELAATADSQALVQLVLSSLRGLGVVRLFGPAPAQERRQLQLLAQLIESHCRAAVPTGGGAASHAPSSRRT
ncbi:MAG: TetR/AcrR family transcriptional regulator [Burkholderiales bacterium]|nr:TetR/AcrR family transcriptional regulator [Burkholderiales bacterium]